MSCIEQIQLPVNEPAVKLCMRHDRQPAVASANSKMTARLRRSLALRRLRAEGELSDKDLCRLLEERLDGGRRHHRLPPPATTAAGRLHCATAPESCRLLQHVAISHAAVDPRGGQYSYAGGPAHPYLVPPFEREAPLGAVGAKHCAQVGARAVLLDCAGMLLAIKAAVSAAGGRRWQHNQAHTPYLRMHPTYPPPHGLPTQVLERLRREQASAARPWYMIDPCSTFRCAAVQPVHNRVVLVHRL